jgi:4-hydroxy-4-methyl-2-oxoglutarate aldolase
MATLTERLEKCYASAVHDVLREMGHSECVLPPEIRLMDPTKRLAGEIYTVSGQIDMSISRHESLLMWARVLSRVPSSKVVVCQPNTRMVALMGELSAHALVAKGTRGYIVDGHARDVEQLLDMGFPIAADLATPADIVERWRYTALGEPITIGRVTIQSGDYAVVDRDGAIIIPKDMVEEAVTKTEAVMATESEMRVAIIGGMDAEEAYLKYGKF